MSICDLVTFFLNFKKSIIFEKISTYNIKCKWGVIHVREKNTVKPSIKVLQFVYNSNSMRDVFIFLVFILNY